MAEKRLIDANALIETLSVVAKKMAKSDAQKALMGRVLYIIEHKPTVDALAGAAEGGYLMPRNVKCRNCNNLINGWCDKVIDSPDPDMIRDCWYFRQKTNADRIRAMSDRELADFLSAKFADLQCQQDFGELSPPTATQISALKHTWYVAWMQWLQQPAEEA